MTMAVRLVVLLALSAVAPATLAQEAAFVIRHTEKEATGDDPGLTPGGREMALGWSRMLANANIDIVFHTDAKRARETGTIIAEALGTERIETPMADITAVMDLLEFDHADDKVLIVGHTETIPGILSGLGVDETVEIPSDDYRNLFLVTFAQDRTPTLTRLRLPHSDLE